MDETRRTILKLLLWSLAFAAAAGVVAVLLANEVVARVTGTAFLTAAAALLLLWFSNWLDKPKRRPAGLFGMVAVVVEFLLVNAAIWEVTDLFGGFRQEEALMVSCLIVPLCGSAGILFLHVMMVRGMRVAGRVGFGMTLLAFVMSMAAAWMFSGSMAGYSMWETVGLIAWVGPVIAASLVGLGMRMRPWTGGVKDDAHGSPRHWRWLGVNAAVLAAGMILADIWSNVVITEEMTLLAVVVALLVAFVNLVTLTPLRENQQWLGAATLLAGAATALFVELIVFDIGGEAVERLSAAAAILTASGSVALLVLAAANRRQEFATAADGSFRVCLVCPRCRVQQEVSTGQSKCKACGLKITLRVEEPRCTECGYLLHMSEGDACPECGTTIVPRKAAE